ncbi:MAG: small multi-drug export protein [archaeon]
MDSQLILSIILSFLPFVELRAGLPVVIDYCLKNGLNIWPYFSLVVLVNILVTLFVFFFMDFLHVYFMKINYYKNFMDRFLERVKRKGKHLENKEGLLLHFLLCIFVAIPLPGTGAWTGAVLAWLFGFNRKASFISISLGVLIAGFLVLAISLGIFSMFN